jgi:hypothetical protein
MPSPLTRNFRFSSQQADTIPFLGFQRMIIFFGRAQGAAQGPGGQRRSALPDSFRTHEPEGRILCQTFSIVHVFVPSQSAVYRLTQQDRPTAQLPNCNSTLAFCVLLAFMPWSRVIPVACCKSATAISRPASKVG